MAGKRILVVTTVVADEGRLAEELRGLLGDDADVRVVAPAAKLSWLDWLTNDEDEARAEAVEASQRVAAAIGGEASVEIDRASRDSAAAQAVEDALRSFPAEELSVLTRPGKEAGWLEEETVRAAFASTGLPVRHLQLTDEHDRREETR